jgi:hypothetical protein
MLCFGLGMTLVFSTTRTHQNNIKDDEKMEKNKK